VLDTGVHKIAEVLGSRPRMLAPDVDPGALDPLTGTPGPMWPAVQASGGSLTPLQQSWLDTGGPPVRTR